MSIVPAGSSIAAASVPPPASDAEIRGFWRSTLDRLSREPLAAAAEPLKGPLPYVRTRLTYASLGGVRVRAYLSLPWGMPAGTRFGAIVTATGAGGWQMGVDLNEAQRGWAILQVYTRGQGESAELWRVDPACEGDWLAHGASQPDGSYYQGAYCDLVRGIDYLLTRDDIDPRRIACVGTSQAGALVLGAASIDRRVAAVAAHVPFICDLRNNPRFAARTAEPGFARMADHIDPARLAAWLDAPTLLTAGGSDETCPPATIHAVYQRLPGVRALFEDPALAHTSSLTYYRLSWTWLERYLTSSESLAPRTGIG